MNFCHECQGLGKIFDKENSKEICQVCGGFGLIIKQEGGFQEKRRKVILDFKP